MKPKQAIELLDKLAKAVPLYESMLMRIKADLAALPAAAPVPRSFFENGRSTEFDQAMCVFPGYDGDHSYRTVLQSVAAILDASALKEEVKPLIGAPQARGALGKNDDTPRGSGFIAL